MVKKCICGSAIPFKNEKVLLVKHKKLGVWLNPGGHVEQNETPSEAALRETLEETGIKAKLIDVDRKNDHIVTKITYEVQKPFLILYENVEYKTETHEHFDMIYVVEPEDEENSDHKAAGELEMRWFNESEIDNLNTFDNVKASVHKVFSAMRTLDR